MGHGYGLDHVWARLTFPALPMNFLILLHPSSCSAALASGRTILIQLLTALITYPV